MSADATERAELEQLRLATRLSGVCTWSFEPGTGPMVRAKATFTGARAVFGYDDTELPRELGAALELLVVPGDRARVLSELQAQMSGESARYESEYRVRHKDGSVHWTLARGAALRDDAGRPFRITGSSVEVTRLKRSEEEARTAKEQMNLATEQIRDERDRVKERLELAVTGSKACTWDFEIIDGDFANARVAFTNYWELLGYDGPPPGVESLASVIEHVVAPEDRLSLAGDLQAFLESGGQEWEREGQVVHRDGTARWQLSRGVLARDAAGTVTRFTGASIDITDRKLTETNLRKAEAELQRAREAAESANTRLQLAMRGSDVAVYEADFPDGSLASTRWTFFNMWEPLGFDAASAPAAFEQLLPLAVHPEDQPAVIARFEAAMRSRDPDWYTEHRVLHRDGSVRWRLSRGTLVFDDAGTIASFIGTEVDITKLKHIEDELQRAREAAEAANRAKDEFLANVSHEIRTPMNAILGMTELALDSSPSEHQRQLLSTVRSAAKNLLTIIDDLLDFSKIESGKLTLDRAEFSLRAVVGDTLRVLAVRAQRKGLALGCRVAPEVPDALEGDAGRLRQVLTNLVGNAIKFTTQGEIEVDVGAEPASGPTVMLSIAVRDTGIGIAPDKQAAIFRAFEQGDASTTRKYGGTGLGLTISAQLASLMDGAITVQSTPGRGSTFRFAARFARSAHAESIAAPDPLADLRVLAVDDSEVHRPIPTVRAPAGWPRAQPEHERPLRILVAEDNQLNVVLLREVLARRGHLAQFAPDGRAALELALRGGFELMLLDLHMPELDGFEVVQAIRGHERGTNQHLPIIALTARSSARDRERCLAAGMDEFLAKPIETATLWAVIERCLASWPQPPRGRGVEPGLLDARVILRACGWQAAVFETLRAVFRSTLPAQMSSVRAALASDDLQELRGAAHRLAGTVGTFSPVAAAVASTLEDAAVRHDGESCAALAEQLGSLCDALLVATETLSIDALSP